MHGRRPLPGTVRYRMTTTEQRPRSAGGGPTGLTGLARVRYMLRLWRNEANDPEPFYSVLAAETTERLEERLGPLAGKRIADLGCGPGYYTKALRATGAEVVPVDNSVDELSLGGEPPPGFVVADAGALPFESGSFDGVFCSNLLEHTPNTPAVLREISRVLRPGGWSYLSWTNWYSPWGGHGIAPYHFLGTRLGPELYERRHGAPPEKNAYGDGLWAVHIGTVLGLLRSDPSVEITTLEPRYWPSQRWIMAVPLLREVLAWNCVIWLRKR